VRREKPVYTARVADYLRQQDAFEAAQLGDPQWLVDLRREAMDRFQETGFPSTRLEDWRYTNVAALAKLALEPADAQDACEISGDGAAQPLASDADALRAALAHVPDRKDNGFALLNAAFLFDGALLRVAKGDASIRVAIPAPKAGRMQNPRVLIEVAANASATLLLEQPLGAAGSLSNLVTDASLGDNSSLELVLLQSGPELGTQLGTPVGTPVGTAGGQGPEDRFCVSMTSVRLGRDARLRTHTLTRGGSLVRNDLDVVLAGEGAHCELRGLFLGGGVSLIDNHSSVDHAVPHCTSRELYKGILADRSRGVFRGRVIVRPDAQKSDASQSNPNLLLGEGAEIDSKPQLEIYADDVKCAHGATVGQIDGEALFYLRSRGIDLAEARQLMIRAFANEIVEALPEGISKGSGFSNVLPGAGS
jgi:Fe-S cluster assembly protein SufD